MILALCSLRCCPSLRKWYRCDCFKRKESTELPAKPKESPTVDHPQAVQCDPSKDACSICLELNSDVTTHCGHDFHSDCLKNWDVKSQDCPNCKQPFERRLTGKCSTCGNFCRKVPICHLHYGASEQATCIRSETANGSCQQAMKLEKPLA